VGALNSFPNPLRFNISLGQTYVTELMSSSDPMTVIVPSEAVPRLEFYYNYGSQTVTCVMPDDTTKRWRRISKSGLPDWDSFDSDLVKLKQAYEHELTDKGVKPDGWPDHPETGLSIIDRECFPSEAAKIKWKWDDGTDTAEADGGGTTDSDGNGDHQNGE